MYAKNLYEKLVNKHKNKIIEAFHLQQWRIRTHFYVSGSAKLRSLGMKKSNCTGCHAITFMSHHKTADMIFFL